MRTSQNTLETISTIGIDVGKNTFHRDAGHVAGRPVQADTRPSGTGSEPVSKTTGMLVVTGGAPKIARGQKLVVGEPRPSASLLVKFWLPESFF